MIKKFKTLYWKLLLRNKEMSISNIVVIAVVTLIISLLFNIASNSELQLKTDSVNQIGNHDLEVGYEGSDNNGIDGDLEKKINNMKSITKVSPATITTLEIDGVSIYTVGVFSDSLSKSKYKFTSQLTDNNVAINKKLSEAKKLDIGDIININGQELIVDDIFNDDINSSSGINILIVNKDIINKLVNEEINSTFLMINVKSNVYDVSDDLKELDSSFKILILQDNEFLTQNISSLKYFLVFIGFLTFGICGIFVMANMKHYLYKYTKDFAIMKALGASRKNIFNILFMQGLILNIIGISFGIILHLLIIKFILNQYVIFIESIIITAILGFFILQFILIFPAYTALKILPIRAISNREIKRNNKNNNNLKKIYIVMLIGAIISVKNFIFPGGENSFFECILAFVLILISTILFLKEKINIILYRLEKLFAKLKLNLCKISVMTIKTHIDKNFIIIVALAISTCISIMGGSFVNLLVKNNEKYYREEYLENIIVNSNTSISFELANNIFNEFRSIPSIVTYMRLDGGTTSIDINGKETNTMFSVATFSEMAKANKIKEYDGKSDNKVVITKKIANKLNIKIGDIITLNSPKFEYNINEIQEYNVKLEVIDIVPESLTGFCDIMIDITNKVVINDEELFLDKIFIDNKNTDINDLLFNMKNKYPSFKWQRLDEVLFTTNKAIYDRWKIFNIAIILIILTVTFGIIYSIKNNMNSSRKEYAILRCMKFTRLNLIKILLIQVIIFILLGVLSGILIGIIGSVLITSTDSFNIIMPEYKLILINFLVITFIICIYLIPYIIKFTKISLNKELTYQEG